LIITSELYASSDYEWIQELLDYPETLKAQLNYIETTARIEVPEDPIERVILQDRAKSAIRKIEEIYKHAITLLGVVVLLALEVKASDDYGPLKTCNRFPLHMLVLTPRPVSADLPKQGSFGATLAAEYSNTYFNYRNARWDLVVDTEVLVAELSTVYGVTERWAVRLDVLMISMQGGFLDGFLQNYHDVLGVSNYGREDRPKNEFAYRATKDGQLWVQGESGALQISDIRISTQYALPSMTLLGHALDSSVMATLKVPTGDADSGLGSGQYDVGMFLPIKWNGDRWSFYLMPGFLWIDDPQTSGARVSARNMTSIFAGAAFEYNEKWRWLAQLNYYSSPLEETGLEELDDGALELAFGIQRTLSPSLYWEFAFSEDLTLAVPDFNIRLAMTWRFRSP
jgi:hypothetical protein